jgi:conjugal transfer mating pair stabilization protein TraN
MKRLFTLLLLLTHLLAVQTTLAAQCKLLSSTCVDAGTKTINGVAVTRACWDYRNTYDCYDPKSLDYCQALVSQGCQETASTCVDKDFTGACVQYRKQYRCNDKLNPTPTGVVYLNDSYTITEDRIDASQCEDAKANQTCTLAEHRCTEPGATRTINGKAIYKDCWAWEDTYTCLGERLNSCADLQAQGCQYQSKHCVESIPSGACQVWDLAYRCTTPGGTTETEDCSQKGFCLNGQCFDSSHPPDADFAKSVVGMEAVREAGTYLTPELQIFKGLGERCEIKLSGLKNCCAAKGGAKNNQSILAAAGMSGGKAVLDYSFQKASGYMYDFMFSKGNDWMSSKAIEAWGSGAWNPSPSTSMSFYGLTVSYTSGAGFAFSFDPYSFALQVGIYLLMQLLSCEEQEAYLQMKRGADLCHYVGSYCSSKLLGYCLIRKESHCCFNSRLARIIQEQGRPQLGKSWGSAQNPSCGGFTPEEFQRLDFGAMDLSAFIHEVMQNAQVPNSSVVDALVKKQTGSVDDKVKGYFQQ